MDIAKSPAARRPFWKRHRLALAAAAGLALCAVAALWNLGQAMPSVARTQVWIDDARRGPMQVEIRASGTLVPKDIRWITAGTTATVQQVVVLPGARVEPDTVVLRLFNPAAAANLGKAEAALAGAEADVAAKRTALTSELLDHESTLAEAESTFRINQMKADASVLGEQKGVISRLEARQATITADQNRQLLEIQRKRFAAFRQNVQAQIRASEAQRDGARSALEIARQEAASLVVVAGISGILQQVVAEPGQQVAAGANLARVARPEALLARLSVPEVQAKDLVLGLPVNIDTHNGVVEGRIGRIDPAVRDGSVAIDVELTAKLPPGARPDLSVDGRIVLGLQKDVVSIGRPPLAAPNSVSSLFVLPAGADVARRTSVTYGAASSDRIAVLAGLRNGDRVILSDTSQWNQFEALRIR
ncbi:HlyD family efflux transporter periplasmic adaptor subunit [Lysobacter yananisis]|uniref:HlyD family efflux transporter periplasmic adaptor subunit n=1 Tax=Lysobacter yananisis TaxID=1003114 RepID=A0ABY9PEN7_9GAMM|nr:HlyD family efflux transporter periplasmic adaptor subunit [Lysobacter yananisis]WMT05523.1 HlyD family efflux transporter periplasmic adaptor subunit [Lysobacter yananisis]